MTLSSFFRSVSDSDSSSSDEEEELTDSGSDSGLDAKVSTKKSGKKAKGSDDDSDSDSDSDDSDSDDEDDKVEVKKPAGSRFLRGAASDDSDSDDERAKVVKSAKAKRADEVEACIKSIDNATKINDWSAISDQFDKVVRLVARSATLADPVPVAFIKALISLDDTLAAAQGNKKKMNATNAKALNSMKQKLKKTQRDNEEHIKKYKEDPEAFERAAVAEEAPAPKLKVAKKDQQVGDADDDDFQTVGNKGKAIAISSEGIYKALAQVLEARGRKNTDRAEQTKILEKLLGVAATPYQRIRVLLALISALLDYNPSTNTHMPIESWTAARTHLDALLDILIAERKYAVKEEAPDYDDQVERAPTDAEPIVVVRGSVISLVDRLDDEFTKSLQNIDPHTGEYIDRLKDEKVIYETIVKSQVYYEQIKSTEHLDRVVMRRLEHIYCKPDPVTQALEAALPPLAAKSTVWASQVGTSDASSFSAIALVRALCIYLYKTSNSLLRTRAMLSHIYHYALHDDYYTARDMLLMSHLQDTVGGADVGTQILYNRTVVQVGLCAFRLGLIRESQSTLQEIFATQRVKELLAQGVQAQRYSVLTPEQDKIERQRQLPFHMHINLEMLECAYLVSSMLLEVPTMAQAGNDPEMQKKKVVSRTFRRMLDYANRQVFTGPPENKRDHVMQATKALQQGDWQRCVELVHSIKVWNLMPSEKAVKDMLAKKIQEEGLRTYVFTYAPFYSTLSLQHLASTFDLPLSTATSLVSKMIWNEEIDASLDQVAGVIVLQSTELSTLQRLALQLADKASQMADGSERYLDSKISSGEQRADGARPDRAEGAGGRERRGGGGGGRGRGGSRGGRGGAGRQFQHTLGRTVQA